VTFVQEPASAKSEGMPKSAVGAGMADFVAPVEELPGKIIAYLQRVPLAAKSPDWPRWIEPAAGWKRS
jgi:hypothetical protein